MLELRSPKCSRMRTESSFFLILTEEKEQRVFALKVNGHYGKNKESNSLYGH